MCMAENSNPRGRVVYTVGYGGRSFSQLLDILIGLGITRVIDVRRWGASRRFPEFSADSLAAGLADAGIQYLRIPELGGYRKFGEDVEDLGVATCFESEGFRAFATYVTTRLEVRPHLERLEQLASEKVSVLLCCERLPWRCHRKILSDYLVARGFKVLHVIDPGTTIEHRPAPCAVISNGQLRYI